LEWDYDSSRYSNWKADETFIIDTKWKNINGSKPSTDDLRQMYVYNDYWNRLKAVIVSFKYYNIYKRGFYSFNKITAIEHHECGLAKFLF
jgi:5-methylcytosine-specific restriction enzyme subunit McrC